jgi:hypothetical protein
MALHLSPGRKPAGSTASAPAAVSMAFERAVARRFARSGRVTTRPPSWRPRAARCARNGCGPDEARPLLDIEPGAPLLGRAPLLPRTAAHRVHRDHLLGERYDFVAELRHAGRNVVQYRTS